MTVNNSVKFIKKHADGWLNLFTNMGIRGKVLKQLLIKHHGFQKEN